MWQPSRHTNTGISLSEIKWKKFNFFRINMQINFLLIRDDSRNDLNRKKKFHKSTAHDCQTFFSLFWYFFAIRAVFFETVSLRLEVAMRLCVLDTVGREKEGRPEGGGSEGGREERRGEKGHSLPVRWWHRGGRREGERRGRGKQREPAAFLSSLTLSFRTRFVLQEKHF